MSQRQQVKVLLKITYFKRTGKYYTDATDDFTVDECEGGTPAMYQLSDNIKAIRDSGDIPLPGLCGGWDGFILIDCDNGYPCLIVPKDILEFEKGT